jgi:hypothetical protein
VAAVPAQVAVAGTLDEAAEKWQRKTTARIERWRSAVSASDIGDRWISGIRAKFGIVPDASVRDLYVRFVQSAGAYEKYRAKVSDPKAKDKWKHNYVAGLQGR